MNCPQCQSTDVYLCSVAHEQGKTTSKSSGTSVGAVGGSFATVDHESTTTTLTAFATKAAPPDSQLGTAIGSVVIMLIANYVISTEFPNSPAVIKLLFLIGLGLSAWWLVAAVKRLPEDRLEKARWERSWICARCGQIFTPDETKAG